MAQALGAEHPALHVILSFKGVCLRVRRFGRAKWDGLAYLQRAVVTQVTH